MFKIGLLLTSSITFLIFLALPQLAYSASTHGIEPISLSDTHSTALEIEEVYELQKKNRGLGKLSSWVKQKFQKFTGTIQSLKVFLTNEGEKPTKTHWGAIAGFVCSIASIVIAGIPLGILGVVFSSIALNNISKYPMSFSGKGLAIAGLVIGIIGILGALYVLSSMN